MIAEAKTIILIKGILNEDNKQRREYMRMF